MKNLAKNTLIASMVMMASSTSAIAATVWTDWTDYTAGNPGSASGTLDTVTVSYTGEVLGQTTVNGTSSIWNPETSYVGGAVDSSPDTVGDHIAINGATYTHTITFSDTVTDPVIAIWSLGQPSFSASFTFDANPTLEVGGPNSQFGGSTLVINGNDVSGNEGNGVIAFYGEYESISWTSTNENWYAFTVGTLQPVPVPAAFWLFGSALLGLIGLRKKL